VRIGIDLGGTKIAAVAMDGDGRISLRRRLATPRGDYQRIVQTLADLIVAMESELGTTSRIGIGIPGALSAASCTIKNANSTELIGEDLGGDLAALVHRPVRLGNDANCFTLSEAHDGAACGAKNVFGVILGTGVGGALVINGQLVDGCNRIAGEWGHNPLPWPEREEWPGPACYCGRSGCIETFLSGPGLAADDARAGTEQRVPMRSPEAIVEAAARGESRATVVLERYAQRLARALASVINVLDPEVIVLGGGLSKLAFLYQTVPALWGTYVFSDRVDTTLCPPAHGDASGVRGAAWLWDA